VNLFVSDELLTYRYWDLIIICKGSESSERCSRAGSVCSHSAILKPPVKLEDYEFPFENIVFEGGGNKGLAYAGAVRVFENIGAWPQIIRLSGASAGAMWAMLLAVGYSSHDIQGFLDLNLKDLFLDATGGFCSLIPNIVKHYGWHPAQKLYKLLGDLMEKATGQRDCTFQQVYDKYSKEVCIVVTNVNVMDAEYCHVKTTPHMSIRLAVRMSMAIPGLFCAVKYSRFGSQDCYVDGGVLCNYPIHCFDGWWLSMKPEDSFLRRFQPLENAGSLMQKNERFSPMNDKTIGMLLYSSDEQDLMVNQLVLNNTQSEPVKPPKTALACKRTKVKGEKTQLAHEHRQVTRALSKFIQVLSQNQLDSGLDTVSRAELEMALTKTDDAFTTDDAKILFGDQFTIDEVFDYLDCNGDGKISFRELMSLAEYKGVGLQSYFLGYQRQEIESVGNFLDTLSNTLLVNVKRVFTTEADLDRTLGIDTLYINATDFELEEGDKMFLVQQGERAAKRFLETWIDKHPERVTRKQSMGPMHPMDGPPSASGAWSSPPAESAPSRPSVLTVTQAPSEQADPVATKSPPTRLPPLRKGSESESS
jgi:hypothetical protein